MSLRLAPERAQPAPRGRLERAEQVEQALLAQEQALPAQGRLPVVPKWPESHLRLRCRPPL
jgi:hypothetical protein